MNLQKRVACVTGASKGIGVGICEVLARNGFDLVLIARSEELLAQLTQQYTEKYGIRAIYKAVDVTNWPRFKEALDSASTELDSSFDVFIHNVGFVFFIFHFEFVEYQSNTHKCFNLIPISFYF